jgi:hypothetical protein
MGGNSESLASALLRRFVCLFFARVFECVCVWHSFIQGPDGPSICAAKKACVWFFLCLYVYVCVWHARIQALMGGNSESLASRVYSGPDGR